MNNEIDEELKNEVLESNKKDTKRKIIVFLCVVALALVAAGIYFMKDKLFTEEEIEEETNIEVTEALKEQISKKVYTLLTSATKTDNGVFSAYMFRLNVLKHELDDYDKQYIALNTIGYDKLDDVYKEIEEVKNAIDKESEITKTTDLESIVSKYGMKTFKEVNDYYKTLFGKSIENPETKIGKCPSIHYYEEKNIYVEFPNACGGATEDSILTYISDYKRSGGTIEVYLSIGINDKEGTYADFDQEDKNQDITKKNKLEEKVEKITKENYKDFSQYKLTFTDLGENIFYFNKVEQVK